MAAEVIIELIPNTSKVESAIEQIGNADGSADTFKDGNEELKKRKQIQDQVMASTNKQAASITNMSKNLGKLSADTIKLGANLKKGINEGIADALSAAGVSAEEFEQALNDAGMTMEQYIQTIEDGTASVIENQNAEESLRAEKKRLQAEIAKLILAGEQESEMFQELVDRAGEIDDAMGDAADAIKRTGSDTRALDNLITVAQGVTAGFTVATSAAALFGDESEDTQKALLKVNAAMSLLNGLQQIQTILRSEDNKALAVKIVRQLTSNAQIAIENGLQSKSVIVRYAATAAQYALNAAMKANPISLIAGAVAALIGVLLIFTRESKSAAEAQKELAEAEKAVFENAIKQAELLTAYTDRRIKATEGELALAKARGASNEELYAIEKRLADLRQSNAAKNLGYFSDEVKNVDIYRAQLESLYATQLRLSSRTDEDGKKEKEAIDARIAALELYVSKATEVQNQYADAVIDNQSKLAEHDKELRDRALVENKANIEAQLAQAREGSQQELSLKIQKVKAESDIDLSNVNLTEGERRAIIAQSEKAIRDLRREYNQLGLEDAKAGIEARLYAARVGSEEEFNYKVALIKAQLAIEESNANLSANKRKAIHAKAEREIADITKEYQDRQVNDAAAIEVMKAQVRVAAFIEGSREYDQARKDELNAQAQLDRLAVQQSVDSETVKAQKILLINANLNRALDDINRQRLQKERDAYYVHLNNVTDIAIRQAERRTNDPRLNEFQRFKAQMALIDEQLKRVENERDEIHQKHLDGRFSSEQEYLDALAKNQEEHNALEDEKEFKRKELRNAITVATINASFDVLRSASDAYFSSESARAQAKLDEELSNLDARKEKELEVENLTAAQKKAIDQKYAAEEKRIRKAAAEDEKKRKIQQAIANGFLAVTNILATMPWSSFGVAQGIAIASAAANTALQVASISRTPTGYEKGTDNATRGWHWVGEKGPELLWFNGGEKVKPHDQSIREYNEWLSSSIPTPIDFSSFSSTSTIDIDYELLGSTIAKHVTKSMKNLPAPTTVVNVDGIKEIIFNQNSKTEYLNKRKRFDS